MSYFTEHLEGARQGDADCQYHLAYDYYLGEGVAKDAAESVKWYRKAAEQGHVLAQRNLGHCYCCGAGVPVDKVEAVKWFRRAAEQGDVSAQHQLAFAYRQGEGVPKDPAELEKWARKAAAGGHANAVAMLKELGIIVPRGRPGKGCLLLLAVPVILGILFGAAHRYLA